MESDKHGTGTFPDFMRRWLTGRGINDLNSPGSAGDRRSAREQNEAFIEAERDQLRESLADAAHTLINMRLK